MAFHSAPEEGLADTPAKTWFSIQSNDGTKLQEEALISHN